MEIGDYEVTKITRNSAEIGCTTVTREEAVELLAAMDAAKEVEGFFVAEEGDMTPFAVTIRPSSAHEGEVVLCARGKSGNDYNIARLGPKGLYLYPGLSGSFTREGGSDKIAVR